MPVRKEKHLEEARRKHLEVPAAKGDALRYGTIALAPTRHIGCVPHSVRRSKGPVLELGTKCLARRAEEK